MMIAARVQCCFLWHTSFVSNNVDVESQHCNLVPSRNFTLSKLNGIGSLPCMYGNTTFCCKFSADGYRLNGSPLLIGDCTWSLSIFKFSELQWPGLFLFNSNSILTIITVMPCQECYLNDSYFSRSRHEEHSQLFGTGL